MQASIQGEDNNGCGLEVIDNNKIEHWIEVKYDTSEISYHEQDGYPDDPAKRTDEENEHVKQARRYAKYHAFCERGYLTVEPRDIPEWQAVVATAISQLSTADFEAQFGEYHQQFRSTVEKDVEPVVELPDEEVAGLVFYRQYVSLDIDVQQILDSRQRELLEGALQTDAHPDAVSEAITEALTTAVADPTAVTIADVSGVGALYQGHEEDVVIEPEDKPKEPADARLELPRAGAPWDEYLSIEAFQFLVVHHLLCQIRDCYLQMGLEPPEGTRVLGFGKHLQAVRNQYLDLYEPVHGTGSPVEGYHLPELGTHLS